MKGLVRWAVVFVVLLGLAYLVDHGDRKAGVPVFVWLALNLTLFLYLLARFVGRPISSFLDARRDSIRAQLEEARARLAEAEDLKSRVSERLSAMEAEVEAIKERAEEQGKAEAARISEQAAAEEERFLKRVQDEIDRRGAETREELARETARLTTEMARGLLRRQMTDDDRDRLLKQGLDALHSIEEN